MPASFLLFLPLCFQHVITLFQLFLRTDQRILLCHLSCGILRTLSCSPDPDKWKPYKDLCHTMTKVFFGNKAGFHTEIITDHKKELQSDILSCPYCSTLKTLNCPELCPVICKQDEYSYKDMKNYIFERTKALGNGNEKCDFLYRLPKSDRFFRIF